MLHGEAFALLDRPAGWEIEDIRTQVAILADTTPDPVAIADVAGKILYLNPAGLQLLGVGEEELDGLHISGLHPTWANLIVLGEGIEMALLDGTWRGEAALLTRDGREVPVSEIITLHRGRNDDDDKFLLIVARDISEIKETENSLRKNEQYYRRIVETANAGIWSIDLENRITFVNQKMARLLCCTVDEIMGQPLERFLDCGGGALADGRDGLQHVARRRNDFKFRRKDGTEFWATLLTSPLFDEGELYTGTLGIVV